MSLGADTFSKRSFGIKIKNVEISNVGIGNAEISNTRIIFIKCLVYCFLPNFVCGLNVYKNNSIQLYCRVIMKFSISCNGVKVDN